MRRWVPLSPLPTHPRLTGSALSSSARLYRTPGKVKVHVAMRGGKTVDVDAPVGLSLMEVLRDVAHLDVAGSCNGQMECGTCHVYLSEASFAKTADASEREEDLLAKALEVCETSRLACQIVVTEDLDGLEVTLPDYCAAF